MKRCLIILMSSIILVASLFTGCSSPKPVSLFYHGEVLNVVKIKESWTIKTYVAVETPNGILALTDYPTLLLLDDKGIVQLPYIKWVENENYYEPNVSIVGEYWIYYLEKPKSDYYIFSPKEILNWDNTGLASASP